MEEREVVEAVKYIIEKTKFFYKLKNDKKFLYTKLLEQDKTILKNLKETYKNKEKVNKIRYLVIESLLNNKFNEEEFNRIKEDVKKQYKKNILKSWKKDFSILYVFLFNPIKQEVDDKLNLIAKYIKGRFNLKIKINNFNGPQSFGTDNCWIAFYSPKYKSQSDSYQYFLDFKLNLLSYGIYLYNEKKYITQKKYEKNDINIELINDMKIHLKQNINFLLGAENKTTPQVSLSHKPIINHPLNIILYGPPGTGKTYNTINKALSIIENKAETELKSENREELIKRFNHYREDGQIEFITFHQSYGYEEFVEGIKAETNDNGNINYNIEDGIFKQISLRANNIELKKNSIYNFDENKINIWKISLGDTLNNEDNYVYDYCIKNNKILLGFGNGIDFSSCKNRKSIASILKDTEKYSFPPTAINTLKNKMKIGDIVIVSYGNKKIRAIGKITGNYEYIDNEELNNYTQARSVEWLIIPEEAFSYDKLLRKRFSQMSIYDIKSNVNIENLKELLTKKTKEQLKNYILIIDEINRGNISKIFGELITLIEPSKRLGRSEALKVKLPYSNEDFGVPENLFIIGTMNTADKSIALMDTALRRRFEFKEMMPEPERLKDIQVGNIQINKMLEIINQRIEYLYDRDHTIGHSFFINLTSKSRIKELNEIFTNKIIPLLQEYFYEDWEKIDLILGNNGFIKEKEKINFNNLFKNAKNKSDYESDYEKKIYSFDKSKLKEENYIKIYE